MGTSVTSFVVSSHKALCFGCWAKRVARAWSLAMLLLPSNIAMHCSMLYRQNRKRSFMWDDGRAELLGSHSAKKYDFATVDF